MQFALDCAKYFFSEEEMKAYQNMGFKFAPYDSVKDEYAYKRTSYEPSISFNTLEELRDWCLNLPFSSDVIISFRDKVLIIYDDWIE